VRQGTNVVDRIRDEAVTTSSDEVQANSASDADSNLVALIDHLLSIDTDSPLAALNAVSMPDNNGGRIKF
jgi:hypothetical protein